MGGTPVWLVSVSLYRDGHLINAGSLWRAEQELVRTLMREVLEGRGDPTRERCFRMNLTTCLHRAATDEEVASLPDWFHTAPATGMAGGPVAVLSETVPGSPSTRPCEHPRHIPLYSDRPDLWVPEDCGACEPCQARAAIVATPIGP